MSTMAWTISEGLEMEGKSAGTASMAVRESGEASRTQAKRPV